MDNVDLIISTAKSRISKQWKAERTTWADLAKRLTTTTRTSETFAEYKAAKQDTRTEIKDVGGYVGARIQGDGRRNNENVQERYLVTLDADNVRKPDFMEKTAERLQGTAYAIHTTHSHDPQAGKYRYRVIIPLSRPADPEEAEYIARRMAEDLGFDNFDKSGFRKCQLMFWPSTSKDGVFDAKRAQGEPLDVDRYIGEEDFRDRSNWPGMTAESARTRGLAKGLEDPREKTGLIGLFCRECSMTTALEEHLHDIYEPTEKTDRYTYLDGSTSGGLIIYDDLFAYSHHGTDPANDGHCHNAYDLIRIHKFGHLDKDFDSSTTHRQRPSMEAMDRWIMDTFPEVYDQALAERFPGMEEYPEAYPPEVLERDTFIKGGISRWLDRLTTYADILTYDPKLAGLFRRDTFTGKDEFTRTPPWKRSATTMTITDPDIAQLLGYLSQTYGIEKPDKMNAALETILESNSHDSARDFFDALEWDGIKRMETAAIYWLGAADTRATRQMTAKTFLAVVARTYTPGTKFDQVLVLVGPQGCGKSTFARAMGLDHWFADQVVDLDDKKSTFENIQGHLVIELGELVGIGGKADQEKVKAFISSMKDTYRAAYARKATERPRRCVLIATTNEREFLKDETGERRYWVIQCGMSDPRTRRMFQDGNLSPELIEYMAQVYAEAVHLYKSGERRLFLDADALEELESIHNRHKVDDPLIGMIRDFLDKPLPRDWDKMKKDQKDDFFKPWYSPGPGDEEPDILRQYVCTMEIYDQSEIFDRTQRDKALKDIRKAMAQMEGWTRAREPRNVPGYGKQRVWIRTEDRKTPASRKEKAAARADEAFAMT